MHILYLDDSGSPPNKKEEYFVLGGIAVPEQRIRWLTHQLNQLAAEIEPTAPQTVEFHAADIFGGRKGVWAGLTDKRQRVALIERVLLLLRTANAYPDIVAFACAVHKPSFPNHDPVELAYEEIADRFNKYLERISPSPGKELGLIVLDKSTHEASLQHLARKIRAEGSRWGGYMKAICEVPMFVDSHSSRIIQLADHIAYAVFRYYDQNDRTYFKCFSERFDRDGPRNYGLVHKQTVNSYCECPYCLTKHL